MAGDEVGLADVVRLLDHLGAEAEVADRVAAGLLRVVDEVALGVVVGLVADDLDRVLVGADGAVGAEAVEHALLGALALEVEVLVPLEAQVALVVVDAEHEFLLGLGGLEVVERGLDEGRGELAGAQAVAAADDGRPGLELGLAVLHRLADGGADVLVQRLADGARLLGAVEHGDLLDGGGQGAQEVLDGEGAVQADDDGADLLALLDEVVDGLGHGVGAGAHHDQHALGVGGADVVEQVVLAAGVLGQLVHVLLDDGRGGLVVLVDRLAAGEVHVGVLAGAADGRLLGIEAAGAMGADELRVDHVLHHLVGDLLDLLDLVGGAEAVEEVEERHAGLEGRGVRDQGHVHHFLDAGGAEHGPAGLARGHHVLVIAEDRQGAGGDGAGGDMEDGGGALAGDLVHVRDHQQESLAGGERRGQGAGGQRSVDRARGSGLGLHLDDLRHRAEDVLAALGGEFVR